MARRERTNTPEFHQKRIIKLASNTEINRWWSARRHMLQAFGKPDYWIFTRGLRAHYDPLFCKGLQSAGFGSNILDALKNIPRGKNEKIVVLEDGPGVGNFLSDLKKELNTAGIPSKTVALAANHIEDLRNRLVAGEIDELHEGFSEDQVPKEKSIHAYFAVQSSPSYTIPQFRKDLLLKYAYALKPGGLMLIGFTYRKSMPQPAHELMRPTLLSQVIFGTITSKLRRRKGVTFEQERRGVETAFEKRGFFARFYNTNEAESISRKIPNWSLIVRREK